MAKTTVAQRARFINHLAGKGTFTQFDICDAPFPEVKGFTTQQDRINEMFAHYIATGKIRPATLGEREVYFAAVEKEAELNKRLLYHAAEREDWSEVERLVRSLRNRETPLDEYGDPIDLFVVA